jgi:uncharacterized damage-inducible protein DinB
LSNSSLLIQQLTSFIPFVQSLREVDESTWTTPIKDGKWPVRDIITHIMKWDENFLETTLSKIIEQQGAVFLQENLDFLAFNSQAVESCKTLTQDEIIDKSVFYRTEILVKLKELPDSAYLTVYPGRDSYTLESFFQDLFVSHDNHHRSQIEEFLADRRS